MIVYRVECDHQLGVPALTDEFGDETRCPGNLGPWQCPNSGGIIRMRGRSKPTPWQDEYEDETKGPFIFYYGDYTVCGVATTEKLLEWFSPGNLEDLAELGHSIKAFEVPEEACHRLKEQVVFDRSAIISFERLELLALFGASVA